MLVIDLTLQSDNALSFEKNPLEEVQIVVMRIDQKIRY